MFQRFILLYSHLHLVLPSGVFASGFHTNPMYAQFLFPTVVMYPAHLILFDLIGREIFNKE